MNNRSMIVQCFDAVFKYEEVAALLEICHAVDVSLRTLYGILRKQNFYRKVYRVLNEI